MWQNFISWAKSHRDHFVVAVIILFWLRALFIALFLQTDVNELTEEATTFIRTATLYGLFSLSIIALLLYFAKRPWSEMGFQPKGFFNHTGIGILFGIGMLVQHYLIAQPVIGFFIRPSASDGIDPSVLFSDWNLLPFWILLSVFKGGLEEESWRMLEMTSFGKFWGKWGLVFGLVVGSVLFGIQHAYQGTDAVISTGIDGLLYGLIYLRKKSAWEAIAAHATYDIVSIGAGYYFFAPW